MYCRYCHRDYRIMIYAFLTCVQIFVICDSYLMGRELKGGIVKKSYIMFWKSSLPGEVLFDLYCDFMKLCDVFAEEGMAAALLRRGFTEAGTPSSRRPLHNQISSQGCHHTCIITINRTICRTTTPHSLFTLRSFGSGYLSHRIFQNEGHTCFAPASAAK